MNASSIIGVDIAKSNMLIHLNDEREISVDFPALIRRATVLDDGNRIVVETIDGQWATLSALELSRRVPLAT